VTRLYENVAPDHIDHPDRKALRNFTWTNEAINDWEAIWHDLWWLGYKWEWQNSDRYARRYGETFNLFAVHNDAVRLDMAIPLPGIIKFYEIRDDLIGSANDKAVHLGWSIDGWLKEHYTCGPHRPPQQSLVSKYRKFQAGKG
jgi:hypothetical protein